MPPVTASELCRELNLAEPLAGTATEGIVRWVLLEDPGPWGPKTPKDSALPPAIVAWLAALDAQPGTRTQLIRRPGGFGSTTGGLGAEGERRKLILALAPADPSGRRLVELDVTLAELPGLDLDAILAVAPPSPGLGVLWLVCTHGTRDRCCAKWGMPVFEALRQRGDNPDPGRVWQCSHLGGHRFAATFLTLPDGLMWGRFDTAALDTLADALAGGQLAALESLRGRCCYARPAQAAEIAVRVETGLLDDAAVTVRGQARQADGATTVELTTPMGVRQVVVAPTAIDLDAPPSCGDAPERRVVLRARA